MKTILSTILFATFSITNAQTVTDYKYIHVPEKLTDFNGNQYQLQSRLNFYLGKKNYVILGDDKSVWPQQIINNPCAIATSDLVKGKGLTTNKLTIEFKDCKNQTISSFEGKSMIKEFDKGYQEALKKALEQIQLSDPTIIVEEVAKPIPPTKTPVVYEPQTHEMEIKSNLFSDGNKNFQKIDLNNGGFMFMNESGTQVVAKFEPATKPGVYRVAVTNGNTTYNSIGYNNNSSISYEVLENNTWKEVVLKSK